jgi:hypothetical protein
MILTKIYCNMNNLKKILMLMFKYMALHLKFIHNIKNHKDDSKIYSSNCAFT